MNSSRTSRRTSAWGFTLTELMVSTGLASVVGLTALSVMTSTMKLSTQNVVTNVSNVRARQTIDRIGEAVRFAQDTPVLINTNGTTASGTTADGLLVKNALGGPYVFKNTNGQADADIPSGATSFLVQYAPGAGVAVPKVGDFFKLGISTQPELEVATVGTPSTGSVASVQITTRQGITEVAKPGSYTVTGYRFRKEAYVFVQNGTQWDLRRYPKVVASTVYTTASNYEVLANGFQKLNSQAWFTTVTDSGTQACWLRALVRSSGHAEYADKLAGRNKAQSSLTTMPVQVKLWNYNAPPPPP